MKATTREDLNLREDETMCEKCVHENICRREQCGEPFCVIRSCFDFEKKRLRGEWLSHYDYCKKHECIPSGLIAFWWCSQCEQGVEIQTNFCPRCGSDNRGIET